ncbi:MAG: DUF4214 domain-containing protein, partial [Actinomycetota bacterium]|nr:DUF4214 domain-containing protein [Actinomycetota bacterium]
DDEGFVDAAYDDALGRPADGGGRAYWTGRLAAGVPRSGVAGALIKSPEASGDAVTEAYTRLLDRPLDRGGLRFWTDYLSGGGDPLAFLAALATSEEYFSRALPFPLT